MTFTDAQRGRKAQRVGATFEKIFKNACGTYGVVATAMPAGCKRVAGGRIIPVKTPWDWIITHEGKTALIDTKTCQEHYFRHSLITPHQVNEMLAHESNGTRAGYVVLFRKLDRVIFLESSVLAILMKKEGSISPGNYVGLGDIMTLDPRRIFIT